MSRKLKDYIVISLKGLAMGAADVVPGVSGGTIAFISGIYEELLSSISKINLGLFKTLRNEGFKAAWTQLNGGFLASLFFSRQARIDAFTPSLNLSFSKIWRSFPPPSKIGIVKFKPTKAFIRESLFNTVNLKICDTSLDLFSGSGILSLEALSRGIKKAILVEQDLDLVKSIKKNLTSLNEANAIVINKKVGKFLKDNISNIFDIIFLDPPYNNNLLD